MNKAFSPLKEARSTLFDVGQVVTQLAQVRKLWRDAQQRSNESGGFELPSREVLSTIMNDLRGALFPMRLGPPELRPESEDFYVGHTINSVLHSLLAQVRLELIYASRYSQDLNEQFEEQAVQIVQKFAASLPEIRRLLDSDVLSAFRGDPAARSVDEVLLCYPGIQAMIFHRVAHQLFRLDVPLLARLVAEIAT